MVDPTSGIRTELPKDHEFNPDAMVRPHKDPLASTIEYPDQSILRHFGS